MSDSGDADVTRLLRDLTRELQVLRRELDEDRMPSGRQLSRFTSEVAIPSVILILETNIRALKLLRRTIRLAEGREPRDRSRAGKEVRDRAEQLGAEALSRLDETLASVQASLEEDSADEELRQLLDEARRLQSQISQQLSAEAHTEADGESREATGVDTEERDPVTIDVETELQTLKDNLDDQSDADGTDDSSTDDSGDESP